MRATYRDRPNEYQSKYWNVRSELGKNLHRARTLDLHRAPNSLRVLDLGTGFGYFPVACRHYGHSALGLDCPDEAGLNLYHDVCRTLGVERMLWWIRPDDPLPDLEGRFDLVTAFSLLFNNPGREGEWTADDWRLFLARLEQILAPGGRVLLTLVSNRSDRYYDEETRDLFQQAGADIRGREVYFRRLAAP